MITLLLLDNKGDSQHNLKPEKRTKFNFGFLIPKRAIPKLSFSKKLGRTNSNLSIDTPMIIPVESPRDDMMSPRSGSPRTGGFSPRSENDERKLRESEYRRMQRKRIQSYYNQNEENELAMAGNFTPKHRYKVSALEYKAFANLLLMANE